METAAKSDAVPKQIVAAAMSGRAFHYRLAIRNAFLRQTRQRVVFAEHRDHRFALPPARRERGWDSSHVVLDREAGLAQFRFQKVGALGFL